MGVPWYFKKIFDTYPNVIRNTVTESTVGKQFRLFLDFNGIIHHCVHIIDANVYNNNNSFEDALLKQIWLYTQMCAKYVGNNQGSIGGARQSPLSTVFIGIDGMAPMAKIVQQRKRRFLSLWEKNMVLEETAKVQKRNRQNNVGGVVTGQDAFSWDTNAITPGTPFMSKLATYLLNQIQNNNDETHYVLSSSDFIGEGEHKIMSFIRDHPGNYVDIIYGLDADLISLALIEHIESNHEIWLLRESQKIKDNVHNDSSFPMFLFVDIAGLAESIHQDLHTYYKWSSSNTDKKQNIFDYIVLCFTLGNDFIPGLSYLKIKDGGLEKLLRTKSTIKSAVLDMSRDKYSVCYKTYMCVLESIKHQEQESLVAQHNKYVGDISTKWRGIQNYVHTLPQQQGNKFPNASKMLLHEAGWRKRYYYYLFNDPESYTMMQGCKEYTSAINWCTNYYFNKVYDDKYFYPYMYSPTITDLFQHLVYLCNGGGNGAGNDNISNMRKISWNHLGDSRETIMKLVSILPPQSISNIIPSYETIFTDIKLGCVHYYPNNFSIITYLKSFTWECHPIIPHVDIEKVKIACEYIASKINMEK